MRNEFIKRILSSVILAPLLFFILIKGSIFFYFILILAFIISAFEWNAMTKNKSYSLIGFIFLLVSFYTIYKLRVNPDNDYWPLLIIVLICILTDIGGFIFGKIFKGPRLSIYSPNKTYSGAIGSILLTLSSIPFLISFNVINDKNFFFTIIFFVIISAISQIGDLIISYFKRLSNLKDTGNIIPGHGGLLDRIDGMIFAIPFSYILLSQGLFRNILT